MPSMTAYSALRRTPRGFRYLYETLMLSPFPILLSSPEYCPPLKVYRCPADNAGNPSFEMKDPLPSGFSIPHQSIGSGSENFTSRALPPPMFSITRSLREGTSDRKRHV